MKEKVRVTSVGTPIKFAGWPVRAGYQVPLFFSVALSDGTKHGNVAV